MRGKPQTGDRIEVKIVAQVTDDTTSHGGQWITAATQDGVMVSLFLDSPGVQVRKLPKPKVGDVLTADEIRGRMWKRGTMIRRNRPGAQPLVLAESGEWLFVGNLSNGRTTTTFDNLRSTFELLYLP